VKILFTIILFSFISACIQYHTHNSGVTNISQHNNYSNDPVYKSVVQVFIKEKDSNLVATGAGFVIRNINNNSYIVTVQHLCRIRGQVVTVMPVPDSNNSRKEYNGKAVYTNRKDDICVIRAYHTGKQFIPIKITTELPKVGDKVYTIGAAVRIFPTKTDGYVIGDDLATAAALNTKIKTGKKLLSSIAVTTGNSGGPIYNKKYQLVGMLQGSHKEFEHSSIGAHIETIVNHLNKYFKKKLYKITK
jgi:S1-C subfamily serine protease